MFFYCFVQCFQVEQKVDEPSETKPPSPKSPEPPLDPTLEDAAAPTKRNWKIIAIQLVIWALLWMFFLKIGFGAVFFVVSIPCFIYKNLGRRSPNSKAPSAYSVFNPDCERIDGTFTAEQFEKELRFGAMSVH